MTNIREFIKQLGDKAPAFFDTKEATVARWLKTGSIPIKAVERVLVAVETAKALGGGPQAYDRTPVLEGATREVDTESDVDPLTHLPSNIDRRLPSIQALPGHAPQTIEMSPTEQSWGVNLTRPGRVPTSRPLPPMKIRKENGQNVPYVEQPAPITVLPPEMGGGEAGWSNPIEPIKPKESTEGVSQEKVS